MYSKEFMRFLYGYQKEDVKPEKTSGNREIYFKDKGKGKPAEVYVTVPNKSL